MNLSISLTVADEKASKGRNGWFRPSRADLTRMGDNVNITVWSKRTDGQPPIDLYLDRDSALALSISLQEMLRQE